MAEKVKTEYQGKQELTRTNKHNYKLSEGDKADIIVSYFLNKSKQNVNTICDRYHISRKTLYDVLNDKRNDKIINECITETKQNFTKRVNLTIDKALNRINQALDNQEDINLSQLSTALGILYDKSRLESNLSTNNTSINVNVKVER